MMTIRLSDQRRPLNVKEETLERLQAPLMVMDTHCLGEKDPLWGTVQARELNQFRIKEFL